MPNYSPSPVSSAQHTCDPVSNPAGLISFATAENWLVQEELHDFATKIVISSAALYYSYSTARGPGLPFAFAAHINEYSVSYWEVTVEDVKITAAATSLHDVLAYSLFGEGESVLVSRPYQGRFEVDFGNKEWCDHGGC